MTEVLEFDLLDNEESGSVERARETPVAIERLDRRGSYIVAFEDSTDVHEVELVHHADGWRGDCWVLGDDACRVGRCRGLLHHDGPCAHLWAVRSDVAAGRLDARELAEDEADHYDNVDRDAEDFADSPMFDWNSATFYRLGNRLGGVRRFPWNGDAVQNRPASYGDGGGIRGMLYTPPSRREGVGSRATARAVIGDSESARGRGDSDPTTVSGRGGGRGVF